MNTENNSSLGCQKSANLCLKSPKIRLAARFYPDPAEKLKLVHRPIAYNDNERPIFLRRMERRQGRGRKRRGKRGKEGEREMHQNTIGRMALPVPLVGA